MSQPSTAGRLLAELEHENHGLWDTVASAAGIMPERATAAMRGDAKLTLAEQLRLSEATVVVAPRFARMARRLRTQVLAARSFEAGDVAVHRELPVERWERSAQLRR
jgi:hypothetical protein